MMIRLPTSTMSTMRQQSQHQVGLGHGHDMGQQVIQLDEKLDAQRHQRQRHAEIDRRQNPAAREQQFFDRLFHPMIQDLLEALALKLPYEAGQRQILPHRARACDAEEIRPSNVLDVGPCGRTVGQLSHWPGRNRGSMSAESQQGDGQRVSPASFEAARHAAGQAARQPGVAAARFVAGTGGNHRAHVECRACRRVDTGRRRVAPCAVAIYCNISSQQVFQGAVLRSQDFPSYFRSPAATAHHRRRRRAGLADHRRACARPISNLWASPRCWMRRSMSAAKSPASFVTNTSARRAPGPKPKVSFAATVADTIARVYGEYEYRHAETALESYQQPLDGTASHGSARPHGRRRGA